MKKKIALFLACVMALSSLFAVSVSAAKRHRRLRRLIGRTIPSTQVTAVSMIHSPTPRAVQITVWTGSMLTVPPTRARALRRLPFRAAQTIVPIGTHSKIQIP